MMNTPHRALGLPLAALLLSCAACDTASDAEGARADPASATEPAADRPETPPNETLRPLFAAVEADPDDVEARRALGRALHDANRKAEAVPHFEKAAELQKNERTLLDLGIAQAAASQFVEAEQTYRELLELAPDYPLALHNMGNIAYKRGNDERAIEFYRKAIAADPAYMMAYFHMGQSLNRLERYQEAYRSFERALQIEPSNSQELAVFDDALYELASLDIKMGAHERAAGLLAQLIQENPNHEKAYYAYGQVLLHLGREEEAQQALAAHMQLQQAKKNTGTVSVPE